MLKQLKNIIKKQLLKRDFKNELKKFRQLSDDRFSIKNEDLRPCLFDKTKFTAFDSHYVYHPAWAMRVIKQINPEKHIDISSSLYFCANLSAFIPTEFYDYRPAKLNLSNLNSMEGNLLALPFEDNSLLSISCMHTIEHIGLGRYGDILDATGDLKAIEELKRVCAINGNILFVTPIGKPRIEYNAHRIYAPNMIIDYFKGFKLLDFSFVDDNGNFISHSNINEAQNLNYGCGCFWFNKTDE
jgi:SAM-dependent methyltransferase